MPPGEAEQAAKPHWHRLRLPQYWGWGREDDNLRERCQKAGEGADHRGPCMRVCCSCSAFGTKCSPISGPKRISPASQPAGQCLVRQLPRLPSPAGLWPPEYPPVQRRHSKSYYFSHQHHTQAKELRGHVRGGSLGGSATRSAWSMPGSLPGGTQVGRGRAGAPVPGTSHPAELCPRRPSAAGAECLAAFTIQCLLHPAGRRGWRDAVL